MRITKALPEHFETVRHIVHETIETIYPHYYPRGTVNFFLSYHSDAAIRADIDAGCVWVFEENGVVVATGTVIENEIGRLFVLPAFQGHGFGRQIMDIFEDTIFQTHSEIKLDASLVAQSMYCARGYKEYQYNKMATENGDYLCWYEMRLKRPTDQAGNQRD